MAPINRFLTTATAKQSVAIVPLVEATEHGRCFFLELPGEIRNRIYGFAREDKHVRFQSRQSRVAPAKAQEDASGWRWHDGLMKPSFEHLVPECFGSPSEVGEFPFTATEDDDARRLKKSLRQFRGLTQVNRAIRSEFLPLYQKQTTYRMSQLDIHNYMETVLRKECEEVARKVVEAAYDPQLECIGQKDYLDIWQREELTHRRRIHRNIFIDYTQLAYKPVDILPLLLFLGTAPHISVKCGKNFCTCGCGHSMSGLRPHLDELFAVNRYPKLLTWLETCVEAIELMPEPHMHIYMKEGKEPQWMKASQQAVPTLPGDVEVNKWMEEIDLQIHPLTAEFACFAYIAPDEEDDEEEDDEEEDDEEEDDEEEDDEEEDDEEEDEDGEATGTSKEDKVFWAQVADRGWTRRNVHFRKRRCGRPKLERVGRGKGRWR